MSPENEKKPVKSAAKTSTPKTPAAKTPAKKAVATTKSAAKAAPKKAAAPPKAAAPKKAATPKPTAAAKAATAAGIPEVAAPALRHPTHDEIAYRAYFIFISRGGNHGQHEDDWRRAELELLDLF